MYVGSEMRKDVSFQEYLFIVEESMEKSYPTNTTRLIKTSHENAHKNLH